MPWDEGLVNSLVYDAPDPSEGRVLSYVKAINEALTIALTHDPAVFVMGQGVDDPSAMFGTTLRSAVVRQNAPLGWVWKNSPTSPVEGSSAIGPRV